MLTTVVQSLPIISFVILGFLLKQLGLVRHDDGHAVVRLLINILMPALVFVSLARASIGRGGLLLLALSGAAIPLLLHPLSIRVAKAMKLDQKMAGVMVVSTLASTVGMFLFPFFQVFYGAEGLSHIVAFDLGNSTIASSYAYYVAGRYGQGANWNWRLGLKKLATMPLLWGNLSGLAANWSGITLPDVLMNGLQTLASAAIPLAMLTLGLFIELRFTNWRPVITTVALRMGVGFLIGQVLIVVLGLTGMERLAVTLGAAAPIGVTAMVYASLEGLDEQLSAAALSLSLLVALVVTPVAISFYR